MNGTNPEGRQASALDPQALSLEDVARILTASGWKPVSVEMIRADLYDVCTVSVCTVFPDIWTCSLDMRPQPCVHYVPIRDDFSNLVEKVKWCDRNRDECSQIGHQAKAFFASYSTPEAIWRHIQQRLSA